jgi:predicted nucleotidyltransferase
VRPSAAVDPKERLPAEWPEFDPRELLRRLTAAGVDFVVIGGIAVMLSGYGRATRDLDIAVATDTANLGALGEVLVGLEARLRGVEGDVPFVPDARTLAGIELLTLDTSKGWLDVHRSVAGVRSYDALRRRAERVKLDGISVLIASVDDLIAMKRAAGRSQDPIDIAALEVIKRERRRIEIYRFRRRGAASARPAGR